jgi:hypothetical protein
MEVYARLTRAQRCKQFVRGNVDEKTPKEIQDITDLRFIIVCGLNRGRDRQKGIQFRIDAQGDLTVCGAGSAGVQ